MVKRKKTAARAGKAKTPPKVKPWVSLKPKSSVEEGGDSNDGSFPDDNTEAFLPTTWNGNNSPETQVKLETTVTTPSAPELKSMATATSPSGPHIFSPTAQNFIPKSLSTIRQATATQVCIEAEATTVEKAVPISQPQVPASMVRKPTSQIEELQTRIKTLTFELDKKGRDLKSAKNEASMARAKQSIGDQSRSNELRKLEVQLNAKHYAELRALKDELGDVKDERQKATSDLRKLRATHEKLNDKYRGVQKSRDEAKTFSAQLGQEIEYLRFTGSISEGTIIKLRYDLAASNADKQKLRSQLLREQNKERTLRTHYNNLLFENNNLSAKNSEHLETVKKERSEADYQKLTREYDNVVKKLEHEKHEVTNLEAMVESLRNQRNEAREEVQSFKNKLVALTRNHEKKKQKISELQAEITELNTDIELKSGLVELAADIRLRYLESARETVVGISKAEVDRAIMSNGNDAAHRANGVVDAALFKLGLVPEWYLEDARHVFRSLYKTSPEDHGKWPSQILRVIDCRATLSSLKTVEGSKSDRKRDKHNKLDREILELYHEMESDDLEANEELNNLLEKLEELNEAIVEMERSNFIRRRRDMM